MSVSSQYRSMLAGARRRLKDRPELRQLMGPEADAELLHAFLIQWAALSVQLQEPAERVLVEASRRCSAVGEHRVARAFLQIASEAIDRYRLVAHDTRTLAQLWNQSREPAMDLTYLLTQPRTPAMQRLHHLHESLVASSQPWTQLAALYEADAMLSTVVERVTAQANRLLGEAVRPCLRSLDAIVRISERGTVGRTMSEFLEANPERLDMMVEAAEHTLSIYGDFLVECHASASNLSSWPDRRRALA